MELMKKYFEDYFSHWKIELPDKNLNERLSGHIQKSGWLIQYCFGIEDGIEYLDFYASHRMTSDRHERIYENGKTDDLPSMQMFYIRNSDEYGKEAFEKHNQKVTELLAEKGFDKFTINMSILSGIASSA